MNIARMGMRGDGNLNLTFRRPFVKKVTYFVSMLMVAVSTAGAMVVGQSYAASGVEKTSCVTTTDYNALTPKQLEELQQSIFNG